MKLLFAAASAVALLAAAPAFAQTSPFGGQLYGNLGYTRLTLDEVDNEDVEDAEFNLGAVTGRLGTRLNQNLGFEGELHIGVNDQEERAGGVSLTTGLNYGVSAFAVGYLPLTPQLDLFARAGVGTAEFEFELSGGGLSESDSGSETLFGLGAGAQYFFDGVNGVRGEYTRYMGENESAEFDALSIAYVRKF
jgi:opacity protein-like surface antigen